MKLILLSLALSISFTSLLIAETANQAAKRIINKQNVFGYNSVDQSEEEKIKATIMNSELRLNWLMANDDSLSEEIRLRYALKIIEEELKLREMIRSGKDPLPEEKKLKETQRLIAKRVNNLQAEQDAK